MAWHLVVKQHEVTVADFNDSVPINMQAPKAKNVLSQAFDTCTS